MRVNPKNGLRVNPKLQYGFTSGSLRVQRSHLGPDWALIKPHKTQETPRARAKKGTLGGGTGVQGVKIDFLKRGNGVPAPREGVSRLGIRFF